MPHCYPAGPAETGIATYNTKPEVQSYAEVTHNLDILPVFCISIRACL